MSIEHERKFLVTDGEFVRSLVDGPTVRDLLTQGYLVADHVGTSVRIRLSSQGSVLTVKSKRVGSCRNEHEIDVLLDVARELLAACEGTVITKLRFPVEHEGLSWEVDVFLDDNEGLVIAEIEDPPDDLDTPEWCDIEVTDDDRFYNASISGAPFSQWADRHLFRAN
jgi:adenylate cyclase